MRLRKRPLHGAHGPRLWARCGDVLQSAKINGEFGLGAKISTKVRGYPPSTSTITAIEPHRPWKGVAKSPDLTGDRLKVTFAATTAHCARLAEARASTR
jgi:hypothetical protein